jgi:hypothetical protein
MESHKRILSILYIALGSIQFFALLLVQIFISSILPFITNEVDPDERWILELVSTFLPYLFWGLIILVALPSIIGGVALLRGNKWALTMLLVLGCLKLLSFPVGTALGIYTIWVYAEEGKQNPT